MLCDLAVHVGINRDLTVVAQRDHFVNLVPVQPPVFRELLHADTGFADALAQKLLEQRGLVTAASCTHATHFTAAKPQSGTFDPPLLT
jgi:hypothetical protein